MKPLKLVLLSAGPLAFGLLALMESSASIPTAPSIEPRCHKTQLPADPRLPGSTSANLRKLAEYETVCHGAVVDEYMVFLPMPQTEGEATSFAKDASTTLHQFEFHYITPLVVFEPSLALSFKLSQVHHGTYDKALWIYFTTLKNLGITDSSMGTWVLFPEANTPTWGSTDPTDFVLNIKKVGGIQKAVFPDSTISVLLNSRTYPTGDILWNHGSLKSLAPYLKGLPAHLVDRLGYQGFPSIAPAHAPEQYSQLDAASFLPASLALEAAHLSNIHDVWLNTGSFSRIYTNDSTAEVRIDPARRQAVLQSIVSQAIILKAAGYQLSVNLFAEDTSHTKEHTNWSYWPAGGYATSPDTKNFVWFVDKLRQTNIAFSLFDHV